MDQQPAYEPGMFSRMAANTDPEVDPFLALAHQMAMQDYYDAENNKVNGPGMMTRRKIGGGGRKEVSSSSKSLETTPFRDIRRNSVKSHSSNASRNEKRIPFSPISVSNNKTNALSNDKSNLSSSSSPGHSAHVLQEIVSPTLQKLKQKSPAHHHPPHQPMIIARQRSNNNINLQANAKPPIQLLPPRSVANQKDPQKRPSSSSSSSLVDREELVRLLLATRRDGSDGDFHSDSGGTNGGNDDFNLFDKVFSVPVERTKTGLVMKQQLEAQTVAYNLELEKRDKRLVKALHKIKKEQAREEAKKFDHRKKYAHIQSRYKNINAPKAKSNAATPEPPLFLRKQIPPDRDSILDRSLLEKEANLLARRFAQERSKEVWIQNEMKKYLQEEDDDDSDKVIKLLNSPIMYSQDRPSTDPSQHEKDEKDESPPIEDPLKLLAWIQQQLDSFHLKNDE